MLFYSVWPLYSWLLGNRIDTWLTNYRLFRVVPIVQIQSWALEGLPELRATGWDTNEKSAAKNHSLWSWLWEAETVRMHDHCSSPDYKQMDFDIDSIIKAEHLLADIKSESWTNYEQNSKQQKIVHNITTTLCSLNIRIQILQWMLANSSCVFITRKYKILPLTKQLQSLYRKNYAEL